MRSADREPVRVLHVDDEPDFTELAAMFLERERKAFAFEHSDERRRGTQLPRH